MQLDNIPTLVDIGKNLKISFIIRQGMGQKTMFEEKDVTDGIS